MENTGKRLRGSQAGRKLAAYALQYKYRISAAILILIMAVCMELAGPLIIRMIIDDHLTRIEEPGFSFQPVVVLLAVYFGVLLAAGLFHFIQSFLLQATALRIIMQMRMELIRHVQRLPMRYFDNMPTGHLVNRISNDTESIRDLYMSFMATFVVSSVQIVGIFAFMFLLDPRLAAVTLVLVPLFATSVFILLKYGKKYWSAMRARISDMNTMLSESILVMPVLQLFRREKETIREFEALNREWLVNHNKQLFLVSIIGRNFVGLMIALATAGFAWYFGGLSLQTAVSLGAMVAFLDYVGRFYHPVVAIFDQLVNAQRAVVAAERVFELLEEPGTEVVEVSGDEWERPSGDVRFEDVWFAYKPGEYVLKGISFEAKQGETIALVGHTGSGKSSVMNLLLGFYEADRGMVSIDGCDITKIPKQALRKHMAVVLQDPFLFTGNIRFNVGLYNERIGPDEIRRALQEVGADFIDRLPKGIEEPVIERGSTLSAGQRQLITFARALAFNPSILILDEATASIDSETEGVIQNALKVLSRGRTTFVIAHRLSTIRDADQILVLHKGEIVERGTHDELMAQRKRYYKMYELQQGKVVAG